MLPLRALFCSACGERINRQQNEQERARPESVDQEIPEQSGGETVRLSSFARAQLQAFHAARSDEDAGLAGQSSQGSELAVEGEDPVMEEMLALSTPVLQDEVPVPFTPVPEMETQRLLAVPLARRLGRQIPPGLSRAYTASRQITGALVKSARDMVSEKPISSEALKLLLLPNANPEVTDSPSKSWGWLPVLSLVSAIGVFMVALAYEGGRLAAQSPLPLFWCGLLMLFLPIAGRLFPAKPTRQERLALLVVLAIGLFLDAYLAYPLYSAGYDEFLHWRTALDIVASRHLFHANPLLPISSYYPGLEIATTALSSLTGLPLFAAGELLIGLAHVMFVLALYLFFEHFTSSPRTAGIATVLYMANANFFFFDMDFAYESLALPLAAFVLIAVARRSSAPAGQRVGLTLAIWLGLGAVVVTHHVTSFALVAFILLWTAVFLLLRTLLSSRRSPSQKALVGPGWAALVGLVLAAAWLTVTGDAAVGYLLPHIENAVQQFLQILAHTSRPRQLFHNTSGFVVPLWERGFSYASEALIGLGLLFGFFRIWRSHRANAAMLALLGGALAYPVSQALRLTSAGAETGYRATEFVFVGVAFVLALGVVEFWFSRTPTWRRSALVMGAVSVLCFGQMTLGGGEPWSLLPGPYLVSADDRSIEPQGIAAAKWAGLFLGPGQRIASDRINTLLMATYGDEQVLTAGNGNPVAQVFTSLQVGPGVVGILQEGGIRYLVVDRRLSTSLPYVGTYFNQPGPGGQEISEPIAPAALAKFDDEQGVSRIFDSGDIVIYDVEALVQASATSAAPPVCTPTPSPLIAGSYPKVAEQYAGTLYNVSSSATTGISLTGLQQKQGGVCGTFSVIPTENQPTTIPANAHFYGTITSAGQIQFILTGGTGQTTFSFSGLVLPGGNIAGTYCSLTQATGKCSGYGLWNASPVQSG